MLARRPLPTEQTQRLGVVTETMVKRIRTPVREPLPIEQTRWRGVGTDQKAERGRVSAGEPLSVRWQAHPGVEARKIRYPRERLYRSSRLDGEAFMST